MTWEERVDAARHVPLDEIVHRLGLGEPKRSGRQLRMLCPFHGERSPSFFMSPDKGLWKCFGCDAGGDGIRLWMRARRVDFKRAVREMVP